MSKDSRDNRIYIKDWLVFHPFEKPVNSDFFYLRLCNEVNDLLINEDFDLWENFYDDDINIELSCFLVAWFEDVVSEIGLWKAFISQHYKLYGKYLPFYDLEEYYPDEINPQDITFLLWYFFSMEFRDELNISPVAEDFEILAEDIYGIFDEYWEEAPVNNKLKDFISLPHDEKDFYEVRFKIDWLVLNSYLFYYYGNECSDRKLDIYEEYQKKEGLASHALETIIKGAHDDCVLGTITSLLTSRGKDWLAWVLGEEHPLHKPILKISNKKYGRFLYLGEDEKNFDLKHLASGKKIEVTKKSLGLEKLEQGKTVIYMSIIRWMDEWWFTGVLWFEELNDKMLLSETRDPHNINLFTSIEDKNPIVEEQHKYFLEFNHNKLIAFFKTDKQLSNFIMDFMNYHNKRVSESSPESYNEFKQKNINVQKPEIKHDDPELANLGKLIFFNPNAGIEIVYGHNYVIPDKDNHEFDPDYDEEDVMDLISSQSTSKDLVYFLIENYDIKHLHFPGDKGGNALKENFDFMLRFWKSRSYHVSPLVNLV